MDARIPSIHVKVEMGGDSVSFDGSFFIDAINFLCGAERAVRTKTGMAEDVDSRTAEVAQENLRKLLEAPR